MRAKNSSDVTNCGRDVRLGGRQTVPAGVVSRGNSL